MNRVLIITGSRDWTDEQAIGHLLAQFDPEWTFVYHGAARGADMIADRLARAMGFVVRRFPADWDRHGRAAGPIRNKEMAVEGVKQQRVGVSVHLGAFLLPQSVGTVNMVKLGKMSGFEVHEVHG